MFLLKQTPSALMYVALFGAIVHVILTEENDEAINVPNTATTTELPEKAMDYKNACFYAEQELCKVPSNVTDTSPCHCREHPQMINSWVCCNITDVSMISACANRKNWVNLHIRNATIRTLDISTHSFQTLQSLAITDGRIKNITNSMSRAAYVKCLNISNNNLTEINPRAFIGLQNFQVLDISYNNLSRIPSLSAHKNLTADIRGNKMMLCNPLLDSISRGSFKFVGPEKTFCLTNLKYNWFNSTDVIPIAQLEKWKELNSECPKIPGFGNCTCEAEQMSFQTTNNGKAHLLFTAKVDCSGLGLVELPPKLPDNTVSLNVSNNNITSIGDYFHSNPSYQTIINLYADNNQISSMYELEGTKFMEGFQQFFLKRNAIDKIPEYLLSNTLDINPNGRIIHLGGNRLSCDCNSAKMLKLWLLARSNNIPDHDEILCRNIPLRVIDLQEIKMCQSPHDWTDYIYYLIASEVILIVSLILKVSYDYWIFKTAGYLPWPASKMPKLPCDWLCES